jgi:hypothetical protein
MCQARPRYRRVLHAGKHFSQINKLLDSRPGRSLNYDSEDEARALAIASHEDRSAPKPRDAFNAVLLRRHDADVMPLCRSEVLCSTGQTRTRCHVTGSGMQTHAGTAVAVRRGRRSSAQAEADEVAGAGVSVTMPGPKGYKSSKGLTSQSPLQKRTRRRSLGSTHRT